MSYINDKIAEIMALIPTLPDDDQKAVETMIRDTVLTSFKNGIAKRKGDRAPRKKSDAK